MENQRLILFVVLAFLLLMLWQQWMEYSSPPIIDQPAVSSGQSTQSATQPAAVDISVPGAPAVGADAGSPAVESSQSSINTVNTGKPVTVSTDLLRVELNTLGAGINKAWLLDYPVDVDHPDDPFQLMTDQGDDIFTVQGGLIGHQRKLPTHKTLFTISTDNFALKPGEDSLEVEFVWNAPDGVTYKKIYTFHRDSYAIDIRFRVINNSASAWRGYLYNQYRRSEAGNDGALGFMSVVPSYTGAAIFDRENKYSKISFSDMRDENTQISTDNGWVAMMQHYFVSAWLLDEGHPYEIYSQVLPGPQYTIGYKTAQPANIPAGSNGEISARIYVGPKEVRRLKAEAEGLELTVDYGWLTPVSAPLFWLLDKIHLLVGNWGWAIIILTMMIKLVFYPLSAASHKSMANMRRMAPRIKTLKERFGDDKAKLNAAMMELYKKEKINPLGGCLPILIQIPVFIALYWALLESVELRQAPWILWIRDLSQPDPFYVLPILMGVSMLAQQLLSAVAMDPMQKKIMMAMPVMFMFFFLFFPAGLVLYWTVNNLLTISQQYYINKKMGV
jgi:YidC/Oxa1 family membrane protein insertase